MKLTINKSMGMVDCRAWVPVRVSSITSLLLTSNQVNFSMFDLIKKIGRMLSIPQETLGGLTKAIHECQFSA